MWWLGGSTLVQLHRLLLLNGFLNNDIFCGYSVHSCCNVVWNCFALFSLIRINRRRCMWVHTSWSLPWCTYHLMAQALAWSSVCVAKGQSFPPDSRDITGYSSSAWVPRSSFAVSGCTTRWWGCHLCKRG